MRIKLDSNFVDYYDHYFQVTDTQATFARRTTGGPNRMEAFSMLQAMGFDVPPHGIIRTIREGMLSGMQSMAAQEQDKLFEGVQFVVYTDPSAHCGEGKVKMNLKEAFEKYPDCFASAYIRTNQKEHGQSIRLLVIGDEHLWLQYQSKDDWRSNAGDCDITLPKISDGPSCAHIKIPLYAIDFIPAMGFNRKIYAIDFNVAPGLRGTPAESVFSPEKAARLIQDKIVQILGE